MATTTGTRAAASFPAYQPYGSGTCSVAWGVIDLAANVTAADVHEVCKLPAGSLVIGGWVRGEDIDSNATETLDIDVGTPADTDAFGNFGVLNGDAVTNYLPEGGFLIPLHGTLGNGPVSITAETKVQVIFNAVAATFAAGQITVVVFYTNPL